LLVIGNGTRRWIAANAYIAVGPSAKVTNVSRASACAVAPICVIFATL
jgi:hypothetical protein